VCLFAAQDPTSGLKQLLKALPDGGAPKATYVKGDRVMVVAGDLNTLEGALTELTRDTCSLSRVLCFDAV
jgi:hypothetical protein